MDVLQFLLTNTRWLSSRESMRAADAIEEAITEIKAGTPWHLEDGHHRLLKTMAESPLDGLPHGTLPRPFLRRGRVHLDAICDAKDAPKSAPT